MNASRASGFSLLSVLAVLVLVGILYVSFQGVNQISADVKGDVMSAPKGSRKTACVMNRQTLSRQIMTWKVTHPSQQVTLKALRNSGFTIPTCPEGGKYTIRGEKILCSVHKEEP